MTGLFGLEQGDKDECGLQCGIGLVSGRFGVVVDYFWVVSDIGLILKMMVLSIYTSESDFVTWFGVLLYRAVVK